MLVGRKNWIPLVLLNVFVFTKFDQIPRLKPIEEDADDLVKEEEERQLLELEEKDRKEEEMKAIKMDKRHSVPSKRDLPNTKIPAPKRSHGKSLFTWLMQLLGKGIRTSWGDGRAQGLFCPI